MNTIPLPGLDLNKKIREINENGEWIEVVAPKWLYESLCAEDEDEDVALACPYLIWEFEKWLMDKRGISEKSADDYIRAYESAYESLYETVGLDLYGLLRSFLVEIPEKTRSDQTKAEAPGLVEIYVEAMLEELEANENTYTKAEQRAMKAYHAFIVDVAGTSDKTLVKEKSSALPDEEEFLSWLETAYGMGCDNAKKIVSSVKRMELFIPSLVKEPMTFLEVLRALPGNKRKSYIRLVRTKKNEIFRTADCSGKTILNGLVNITYYLNFLNNKKD